MRCVSEANHRVLVIDDNPAIHEDFRKILAPPETGEQLRAAEAAFFGESTESISIKLELQLDSAEQGQVGLAKVKAALEENRPYAMAFVDMRMPPGWDGLKTIEELWKVEPDLQIVICSAYSDNTWSEICERVGRTDQLLILKKPFDSAEVCQLVLALTTKWSLTQQARLKQEDLNRLVEERTAELKQKEISLRQKHKLEAIGSLAGGVAHEFNNILQAIRGYTCFARDELPKDGQPYEDLTHVVEACDRAAAITGQLLSFSRRTPAQKSLHQIKELVTGTLNLVRPVIGEQIVLDVKLDDDAGMAIVDKDLLSQVFLNLCINARDAMPSGGRLAITANAVELPDRRASNNTDDQPNVQPGHYCMIAVADSGTGIPEEVKQRLFEPFFTTKGVGKGTGMGLAMVFGAVQDHAGAITVESSEGQGATFRIYLPLTVGDVAEACPNAEGDIEYRVGKETILLAEDEPMVRDVAVRTLRQAGYQVVTAVDGEDAVAKFREHADEIDMVLLDVRMPKLNGCQAYEQIKRTKPSIKVAFCTGYDPMTPQAGTLEQERVTTVYKPLSPEALLSTVRQTLEGNVPCHLV